MLIGELTKFWNPVEERCGLIVEEYGKSRIAEIRNAASEIGLSHAEFIMKNSCVKEVLTRHSKIVGMFHTHPSGLDQPSTMDIAGWPAGGLAYYIVTRSLVSEWKLAGSSAILVSRTRSSVAPALRPIAAKRR